MSESPNNKRWLLLKRSDTLLKYCEFVALIVAFVLWRIDVDGYQDQHIWWTMGIVLLINFFTQSTQLFLYYYANKKLIDTKYWPRVFPKRWKESAIGSGYFFHYCFFYFLKFILLVYLGIIIFQKEYDSYFVFPAYFITLLLVIFDLCYYVFSLN